MNTQDLYNDLQDTIVAKINGRDVTRRDLDDAFKMVAPKDNWKNPIDATVEFASPDTAALITEAVIFFTGSTPKFEQVSKFTWRVRAAGYYLTIGA